MGNSDIQVNQSSSISFNIFSIEGDLTITSLIKVTTELAKHIENDSIKDMVLDLSNITYMDSSGIRTLVNLKKRVEQKSKKFYLLSPSEEIISILTQTNLDKVFEIIDSVEPLESAHSKSSFSNLLPYAVKDKDGWFKIKCSCPICGSTDVSAFIIDENRLKWNWVKDDPFPVAIYSDTDKPAGYFSMLPTVCPECQMASTDIKRFNVLDKESQIAIKSDINLEQKNLLLKSVKKRKKILDVASVAIGDNFFLYPRDRIAVYKAFELSELCTQTLAISRKDIGPFDIGYLNFWAIRFAEKKLIDDHISSGRTWITQALKHEEKLSSIELAISNFVMMEFNINIGKAKDASIFHKKMIELNNLLPKATCTDNISSPSFWYKQAFHIWQKEIENQSNIMK